jgi:hypothetical protein
MNASKLQTSSQPELLSRIGGAAQGGSTKSKDERESMEREQPGRDDTPPQAAEPTGKPGTEERQSPPGGMIPGNPD